MLQNSVWIYPFECNDYISLLKADLRLGKSVIYMSVDKIDGDAYLKERFGLE